MTATWTASKAFDRVTDALDEAGSRGTGRQRSYRCPAHEDRNPSLCGHRVRPVAARLYGQPGAAA